MGYLVRNYFLPEIDAEGFVIPNMSICISWSGIKAANLVMVKVLPLNAQVTWLVVD